MVLEDLACANIVVFGQVQGVFYRASAMERAQSLNLSGYAQNLGDGSVELVVEGSRYAVEDFVEWCKIGPPSAQVTDVHVHWSKHRNAYQTFKILPS